MKQRIALLFVLLLVLSALPFLFHIEPVNATWLSGWNYYQMLTLGGATGAGTNYQVFLNVYQGSGTSIGNSVYLTGHNSSVFPNDLNFTDDDGVTPLSYWVEDFNSSWAGVWIKVNDDLSSGTVPIYVYYGKSGITAPSNSTSNGEKTFIKFDDFNANGMNTTNWQKVGTGTLTQNGNGFMNETTNTTNAHLGFADASALNLNNTDVYGRWRVTNVVRQQDPEFWYGHLNRTTVYAGFYSNQATSGNSRLILNTRSGGIASDVWFSDSNYAVNTWYSFDFALNSTFVKLTLYYGTSSETSGWQSWDNTPNSTMQFATYAIGNCYPSTPSQEGDWDYVRIRKFATPNEPSYSGWSSETVNPSLSLEPEECGYVEGFGTSYALARATPFSSDNTSAVLLGQLKLTSPTTYFVDRAFLKFDTSLISAGANITSVQLCLYGSADDSTTDFTLKLQNWTGTSPIDTGDWTSFDGVNYDDGLFNTSSWSTSAYNNITISNTSLINVGGDTQICIRSSRDVGSNAPTGFETVTFENAGHRPLLKITWVAAPSNAAPTNDGCAASDLESGSKALAWNAYYTFSVNVSDTDGVSTINYTELRFEGPAGVYTNNVVRWSQGTGSFSVQNGNLALNGSTNSTVGTQAQLLFKVAFDWSFSTVANFGAQVYTIDNSSANDTDNYSLGITFIGTLVLSGGAPTTNTTWSDVNSKALISGTVTYTGTSVALPTTHLNSIAVHDAAHLSQGTNTTATAFSIVITLPSTAASNVYHIYIDVTDANYTDGDLSGTVTVASDSVTITITGPTYSRININTNASGISATGVYDLNGTALSGTITWNDTTFIYASAIRKDFTVSSVSGMVTTIRSINPNSTCEIWDSVTLMITGPSDQRIDVGINMTAFMVSGTFDYDGTPYDGSVTLNDTIYSHNSLGRYDFAVSSISGGSYPSVTAVRSTNPNSTFCIWDSLNVTNIQSVSYFGNGYYGYDAEIVYGYDGVGVSNASVAATYPNGTSMGSVTSNSTGWVTIVIGQGNASSGVFTIYGVSETLWGITVPSANQTFTLYEWTLSTVDVDGNALSNTNITINVSATSVWSGSGSVYVPPATYNSSVTWLQGLVLNSTINVVVSADKSTSLNCTAYPYTVASVRFWAASNSTISTESFAGNVLTLDFSLSGGTYILVCSSTTKPSYILNAIYDYNVDFGTYLVLTHYGNTTLTISYDTWGGGTCIQKTDHLILSAGFVGQRLTINLTGTSGDIGNLEVYVGTRGNTVDNGGFTTTTYASSLFSGNYVFASDVSVYLDWTGGSGGGGGGGGGGGEVATTLLIDVVVNFAGSAHPGYEVNATVTVTWSGYIQIYLSTIRLSTPYNWTLQMPLGLPLPLWNGNATFNVTLTVPADQVLNVESLPFDFVFATPSGSIKAVHTTSLLDVIPPATTFTLPETITMFLIALLVGFGVVIPAFRRKQVSTRMG